MAKINLDQLLLLTLARTHTYSNPNAFICYIQCFKN